MLCTCMCYVYGHVMHGEFSIKCFLLLFFSPPCLSCPFTSPTCVLLVPSSLQPSHILTEFYGIELWMLRKAIEALGREGKAELIPGDNPDGSDAGVKFFS